MGMTLVIDNYDSFTYNLVQMLGCRVDRVEVVRNDAITPEAALEMDLDRLIISPGPGRPEQAGNSVALVQALGPRIPILGVCLGHQAIAVAYGGMVAPAVRLMHGKADRVFHHSQRLFQGVPDGFLAGRYHSLAVAPDSLPGRDLVVDAVADDGTVMAVSHQAYPVFGIQFHPESILTPEGFRVVDNFLAVQSPPT